MVFLALKCARHAAVREFVQRTEMLSNMDVSFLVLQRFLTPPSEAFDRRPPGTLNFTFASMSYDLRCAVRLGMMAAPRRVPRAMAARAARTTARETACRRRQRGTAWNRRRMVVRRAVVKVQLSARRCPVSPHGLRPNKDKQDAARG